MRYAAGYRVDLGLSELKERVSREMKLTMKIKQEEIMTQLDDYRAGQYAGYSYEQASRRAQEVCAIAAKTGQTLIAADHLNALKGLIKL